MLLMSLLQNKTRLFVLLSFLFITVTASAQLKSDKKPTDKKEKNDKKKSSKKEKEEKDEPADKKTDQEEAPADKKEEKTAPKETKSVAKEAPATEGDAAKDQEPTPADDEKEEKADKNKKTEAPDPEDPTAKTVAVKLTFGPEYSNERNNTTITNMLRDDAGNIHIIKQGAAYFSKTKTYISAYDSKLNELYDDELDLGSVEGTKLDFEGALVLAHQAYIRADHYSKSKDKHTVYLFPLGAKGKIGKPKKITEWDADGADEGSCGLKLSRDHSKLLVFKTLPVLRKDTKLKVEFTVLDKDLNPIWAGKTSFVSEMKGGFFTAHRNSALRNLMVDNLGRVFVLKETEREGASKDDASYITDLYQFVEGENEPIKYNLDLNKKTIRAFALIETNNPNELVGAGSYSENKKISWFQGTNIGSNGTFLFRLDVKSGEVSNKSLKPFSNEMFDFVGISESKQAKGEGIYGLQLLWYYITDNDNVVLSFDQKYSITTTYTDSKGNRSSTTTYYSQCMVNVKYSKTGELIYQTFIPKSLTGSSFTGMGHTLAPHGEQHALIFNDNRKNTEKKLRTARDMSSSSPGGRQCVARLVTLDERGKRKVSTLFSHKEEGFVMLPNVELDYEKGTLITIAIRGKNFKLVKINF
jgi:hypothetical protein